MELWGLVNVLLIHSILTKNYCSCTTTIGSLVPRPLGNETILLVNCFIHRVVTLVADKLMRQWFTLGLKTNHVHKTT